MSAPFIRRGYHPQDDDYYLILDVDFHASQDTITSAYRNLARRFHPDKNNQDDRSRKEAEILFHKIKRAYEVLSDPRRRQIYDTLGPEGLKYDEWQIESKRMTAKEIRDEYLRIQKENTEKELVHTAKPRASLTVGINASNMFSKHPIESLLDDEEERDDTVTLAEVSSMQASIGVNHNIDSKQSLHIGGDINAANGVGEGSLKATYRYSYSDHTAFHIHGRSDSTPFFKTGVSHKLNDKTTVKLSGFVVSSSYVVLHGAKISFDHIIRKNLIGKVSYTDYWSTRATPNFSASLIYVNAKLLLTVTTSYQLDRIKQGMVFDVSYRFNNDHSKLNVSVGVNTKDGAVVEYGCTTTVFEINLIGASLSFGVMSGVTLKLVYNRANQEILVPIYLSDEIYSGVIFYGTITPLIAYYVLDRCYLQKFKKLT